jgi:hypothetical protein
MLPNINEHQALEYELGSSVILSLFPSNLVSRYFAWKTRRKYQRYLGFKALQKEVEDANQKRQEMLTKIFS